MSGKNALKCSHIRRYLATKANLSIYRIYMVTKKIQKQNQTESTEIKDKLLQGEEKGSQRNAKTKTH